MNPTSSSSVPPFVEGSAEVTEVTVVLDSPLELECYATGAPAPSVRYTHTYSHSVPGAWPCVLTSVSCRWVKDGQPLGQGEGVRVAAGGRRLLLARAQASDTARFQCVATNEAGEHDRDFNVAVHGNIVHVQHRAAHRATT